MTDKIWLPWQYFVTYQAKWQFRISAGSGRIIL